MSSFPKSSSMSSSARRRFYFNMISRGNDRRTQEDTHAGTDSRSRADEAGAGEHTVRTAALTTWNNFRCSHEKYTSRLLQTQLRCSVSENRGMCFENGGMCFAGWMGLGGCSVGEAALQAAVTSTVL